MYTHIHAHRNTGYIDTHTLTHTHTHTHMYKYIMRTGYKDSKELSSVVYAQTSHTHIYIDV
jgi:hypothetical protein